MQPNVIRSLGLPGAYCVEGGICVCRVHVGGK